jgi:ankyrin repeat protein
MPAAPAARAMASSSRPAAASATAESLDAPAALREAAQSGNVQRLAALLTKRIDIDARDTSGRSALMLAVLHDRKDAVNSLLAAGADPNAADISGTTPLEAAMATARPEIAAALRRAGAR